MFSFFKKKSPQEPAKAEPQQAPTQTRQSWLQRLGKGLQRTGQSISNVFTGTRIDDALYEELETALLMADTGVAATEYLLKDLKQRVKEASTQNQRQSKRSWRNRLRNYSLRYKKH